MKKISCTFLSCLPTGRFTKQYSSLVEITEFSSWTAKGEYPGWGGMSQTSPYKKKRI